MSTGGQLLSAQHALADLLERARAEQGMSLRALGRKAGLGTATIAEILGGKTLRQMPRTTTLHALASALGLNPDDVELAAIAALHGHEVRVRRAKVAGGQMEIRYTADPGEPEWTPDQLRKAVEAAQKAVDESPQPLDTAEPGGVE